MDTNATHRQRDKQRQTPVCAVFIQDYMIDPRWPTTTNSATANWWRVLFSHWPKILPQHTSQHTFLISIHLDFEVTDSAADIRHVLVVILVQHHWNASLFFKVFLCRPTAVGGVTLYSCDFFLFLSSTSFGSHCADSAELNQTSPHIEKWSRFDDDDDEIAYFTVRWKTRASFVYRTKNVR